MKNKFFDTALGKSIQTLAWTLASYVLAVGLVDLSKVHWSEKAFALGLPGLINLIIYTVKVFVDKEVPNLPDSLPMKLVADVKAPTVSFSEVDHFPEVGPMPDQTNSNTGMQA